MRAEMSRYLNITELFSALQRSTNEETAKTISHAFEQAAEDQELRFKEAKKELIEEINLKDIAMKNDLKDLATKEDLKDLATKEELKDLATKDELKNLATKDELREAVKNLATKDELREAVKNLATKDELREAVKNLATKDELREAVKNLATKTELQMMGDGLRKDMALLKTEMRLDFNQEISKAKWQVIGTFFVFFIAGIVAKHYGF